MGTWPRPQPKGCLTLHFPGSLPSPSPKAVTLATATTIRLAQGSILYSLRLSLRKPCLPGVKRECHPCFNMPENFQPR